jgi:lipid-A-disaccharide synthase
MIKTTPTHTHPSLFLFAGEQSGDVLGANLIHSLKQHVPTLDIYGVGGEGMQKAGLRVIHPMERFQVMGFSDVIKSLPRLYTDFKKIQGEILHNPPAAVVLIDYPDFNMRLAKALRKRGYRGRVIHYVCPSVWAWRKSRVHSLAKTLDHLLAILPFEEMYFAKTNLPVTYVGHPLVSAIDHYHYDPNWKIAQPLIAIFPGSRRHEIELNLPLQLEAAKEFAPHYTLAISVARPELYPLIQNYAKESALLVPSDKRYELMRAATCALATSGTIVLELGLHSVPTVVTYQLATLNYLLGRYAFRIHLPFYTLVNIICGKEVYPEFIHKTISPHAISQALHRLIDKPEVCKQECARLRQLLTTHDASMRAAETITRSLNEMPLS